MSNPATQVIDFVLTRLADEPIAKRIAIKRALAAMVGNSAQRRELLAMADDLEAIERRHAQMLLNFKKGAL